MSGGSLLRIVVAPDKFKGTLSAQQAAAAMAEGVEAAAPGAAVVLLPVADGGEGTVAAFISAGADEVVTVVTGPLGVLVPAVWGRRGKVAVIEAAQANGLDLVRPDASTSLAATTFGVGELIRAAMDAGCVELVLAVGGSATTDGGLGMAVALGAIARDGHGNDLAPGGGSLVDLAWIGVADLDPRLRGIRVVIACDVDNPLSGAAGAASTYGPQKGAGPAEVALLDNGLTTFAAVVAGLEPADLPGGDHTRTFASMPGAGAAGGLAAGAIVFLGGELVSGADLVLDLIGADTALSGADLVITGEGSLDAQSLRGKGPGVIASRARRAGADVLAVAGMVDIGAAELLGAGIGQAFSLLDIAIDAPDARARAAELLSRRTSDAVQWWLAQQ
jgi:glycerate kinase